MDEDDVAALLHRTARNHDHAAELWTVAHLIRDTARDLCRQTSELLELVAHQAAPARGQVAPQNLADLPDGSGADAIHSASPGY